MNRLAISLAKVIRERVISSVTTNVGFKPESRFIFHGPPIEILEQVFLELESSGGIAVQHRDDLRKSILPVLLILPTSALSGPNPDIGKSGKCDENHLLHIRNDPNAASFVALLPPGQHSSRSIASTTEEFGLNSASNTAHATFEEWWDDGFIQQLVSEGLTNAGIGNGLTDEGRSFIESAAMAVDEVEHSQGDRTAVWRLLSRIFSIADSPHRLTPGSALALACGFPPMQEGILSATVQIDTLTKISEEMADGFKTAIDRLTGATEDEPLKSALTSFLEHIQRTCYVTTAFERATSAFYLPSADLELSLPPTWWGVLTCECWGGLLADEPEEDPRDLSITCKNAIIAVSRGQPAIVESEVELLVTTNSDPDGTPVEVTLTGGSAGRTGTIFNVAGSLEINDTPPTVGQRSPISYKVAASGRKSASTKVISLASWAPGILVTSRMAIKLTPPKKPRRGSLGANWETTLSLPGSGRYELMILTSSGVTVSKAVAVPDDATEFADDEFLDLLLQQAKTGGYHLEIEADGKYQLEISFNRPGSRSVETCRVFVICEETREEGCKSEFERLIRLNRRHLDKFEAKAVVHLDRHARLSSLQSWMLDEQAVGKSYIPLVLSDDYGSQWAAPDWNEEVCPILSKARFLHDPRPAIDRFLPPHGFVEARQKIARRIRETSEQAGLVESAPLGSWLTRDEEFSQLVEAYLDAYSGWLAADRDVACWVDTIAVCRREADGRTLARVPDAIILSPLHPLRFAWHCLAQGVLYKEIEGNNSRPCPAASIFDPDCIPDTLELRLQAPGGPGGIDPITYLSVECNSDYWSVLWHGERLDQIGTKSRTAPFDEALGLVIGGIASGFSPAQVARAMEDISDLLPAKPILSIVVSSGIGASDACNEGLEAWCARRFGNGGANEKWQSIGTRELEIYDTRQASSQPDHAMIANLSEDTDNQVRWYLRQPAESLPDLGIIAQLDTAQPEAKGVGMRSALGFGALIRHRVRRRLHGLFLSESRQSLRRLPSGDTFADKVADCVNLLESSEGTTNGLQFAPNVHAVSAMLQERKASFVAVSSSAIDPACFLGGWIPGTYLWDFDLPSYSHRAGDTSGYYLLSQVRDADRDALGRILRNLPTCSSIDDPQLDRILLEVASRGIPTVRGLSGDDTGATGDLGLFLAVRLLQDQFRATGNRDSLLPVMAGVAEDSSIAIVIPVDPFRGYLADMARSIGKDRKDSSLSRPDLLVVGIHTTSDAIQLHITPIEVKCRQHGSVLSAAEAREALGQAKVMAELLRSMQDRAKTSIAWKLGYQHLLMSMIGFGLRVYSQQELVSKDPSRWAGFHERIAETLLSPDPSITIDSTGRLIVIDGTPQSGPRDNDGDGFEESIAISPTDSGKIVGGDPQSFYDAVRTKVGDWRLMPLSVERTESTGSTSNSVDKSQPKTSSGTRPSNGDKDAMSKGQDTNADQTPGATGNLQPVVDETTSAVEPIINGGGGIVLSVGHSVDGFEPRQLSLNISDTRLNQLNIGVVGDLGTGKTQLLKSIIAQLCSAGQNNRGVKPRFLIFDYKRDYSNPEFVEATGARVVKPSRLPLNLFDTAALGESMAPWLDRFRFFADVLDKVYSGIGPVQRDKLKGAVRTAYDTCAAQGRQPTIYDIHAEYRTILSGRTDSPMAIIDDLVDMEVFEKDPSKTKPFSEFLEGIVVVSLDAMGQDDRGKNMLVAIMLNMFYENMLKTPKRPFEGTGPQLRVIDSYLLVDEADNIMRYEFDVLRKLLLQGREFGTGVILASQYLRHFKASATDYKDPLLTWFIHKVPNVTPSELGALGFTSDLGDLSERVKTLPNHHCLYKSFDSSGEVIRGLPFYELMKKP
jgi:DNA phosphorothioation-dependent restriction protein DptH